MCDNAPQETRYIYTDLDSTSQRLNGARAYTVTFAAGQTPPVDGFWSLTLYNKEHLFAPNPLNRYSLGTKSKSMKPNADGSLTIYVQHNSPGGDKETNWLPAPKDDFPCTYEFTGRRRNLWRASGSLRTLNGRSQS
jgi:hypothetical protein